MPIVDIDSEAGVLPFIIAFQSITGTEAFSMLFSAASQLSASQRLSVFKAP